MGSEVEMMELDFHINTEKYKVNPITPDIKVIKRAAELIKSGGIIVYPTDTLYGIGVNANNPVAMKKLYELKKRDSKKPVSLMVKTIDQIRYIVGSLTQEETRFIHALTPGKVTIIVEVKKAVQIPYMEHLSKIGFRIPKSPLCLRLVSEAKCPITSTSLNRSSDENIMDPGELDAVMQSELDLVLDGGPVRSTNGSTVIDATTSPATILRAGDVPLTEIERKLGHKVGTRYPSKFMITFICSGNICRSPMAQGILKQIISRTRYRNDVSVHSAGILPIEPSPAAMNAIEVAQANEIDLHQHISRPVSVDIMNETNLVICMAWDHYQYLQKKFPTQKRKIILLKQWYLQKSLVNPSIKDPVGQNIDTFTEVFNEIQVELKRILPYILKEIKLFMAQSSTRV